MLALLLAVMPMTRFEYLSGQVTCTVKDKKVVFTVEPFVAVACAEYTNSEDCSRIIGLIMDDTGDCLLMFNSCGQRSWCSFKPIQRKYK